jgi:phage anti-repressor protein
MAKISEETEITISLKSLVAFLGLTLAFVVTYFETMEELHMLQKEVAILKDDMEEMDKCDG